jgi:hypothetical protein
MHKTLLLAACLLSLSSPASAQAPASPQSLLTAQRAAMEKLAFLDGVWRGPAWSITPDGRYEIIQTERIGPLLGSSVRVIEGRGYNADGSVGFNALGIISFDPGSGRYSLHSYALGRSGDFPFTVTPNGYQWEVPAGPGAVVRYSASVEAGVLREVGYYVAGNAPQRQIFEMNLKRIGDTGWPAADPVPMR